MTYFRSSRRQHPYARMVGDLLSPVKEGVSLVVVGRVYLIPIQVRETVTIDRLGTYLPVGAGNIRMGLYRDNGDTPVGGALIVETASVAAVNGQKNELVIPDTQLLGGLYWGSFQNDDALVQAHLPYQSCRLGGALHCLMYAQAYGAFTNPCPAAADWDGVAMYLRVKSIP
jgi:hypothetical protein